MKLIKLTLIGCLGLSLFTGCAVKSGNEKLQDVTQTNVTDIIKDGISTKADLRKNLGEPSHVDFMENGLEKWQYNHSRKVEKGVNYVPIVNWFVQGTNDTKRTLVILIDGDVVKKHTFSLAEDESYDGLIR